jgi:hypothetical protein
MADAPNAPDTTTPTPAAPGQQPPPTPPQPDPDNDDAPIGNRGLTKRFKKFEKNLLGTIESLLNKRDEGLLAKLKPAPEPPKEPQENEPAATGTDPVIAGLQQQIEELKADNARKDAIAANERDQRRNSALRQRLTDELIKGGTDATRARHAVGFLVDVEKRVKYAADDSDELVFAAGDEELDVGAGIKAWLKSEDGKLYLPPRGVAGSGDRGGGVARPPAPPGQPDRTAVSHALLRVLDGG